MAVSEPGVVGWWWSEELSQVNVSPAAGPRAWLAAINSSDPELTTTNLLPESWSGLSSQPSFTEYGPICVQSGFYIFRFPTFYFFLRVITEQIMGKKTRMKWRRLDILQGDETSQPRPDVLSDDTQFHYSHHSHHSHPFLKVSIGWFLLNLLSKLITSVPGGL